MSANLRNYVKSLYAFDHVLRLTPDHGAGAEVAVRRLDRRRRRRACARRREDGPQLHHDRQGPKSTPKVAADPIVQWAKLRDTTIEALDQPDVLESIADEPFAPVRSVPVDACIGFMSADLVVHAWDLARTAKVDERLDPALCKASMAVWKSLPDEVMRGPGMFGPAIKPAKGADAQTRMLNFLGRAT